MDEQRIKRTRGQVLVTIMLAGLVAMLALVLDGSNPKGMKECPVYEAAGPDKDVKTIEGCFL